MLEAAVGSGLHIVCVACVFLSLGLRTVYLHGPMDAAGVQRVLRWDNGYGIVTIFLYGSAFWRLFGELEKPLDFYTGSWVFWAKMGAIGIMGAFEMLPMVTFLGWRVRISRGQQPDLGRLGLLRAMHIGELTMLPVVIFLAAFMARGYGQMDVATLPDTVAIAGVAASPVAGRDTFGAMCAPCHGADGRAAQRG